MHLKKNGLIEEGIMSFSLSDEDEPEQTSFMIFGGIDEDQYTGRLQELPLVTNEWWAVEVTSFLYGGEVLKKFDRYVKGKSIFKQPNSAYGIIDTGSNFIFIPSGEFNKLVNHIQSSLNEAEKFTCKNVQCFSHHSCSNYDSLEDITFEFAKIKFNMSPATYLSSIP